MARKVILLGFFALLSPQVVLANSFSLPLNKKTVSNYSLPRRRWQTAQVPEINDGDFWFANWSVGSSKDLVLLIDTGSPDVYLNPDKYAPSATSTNEHQNFSITFGTTNPDGSGSETVIGSIFKDVVKIDHTDLSVPQQPLGAVSPTSSPAFPHDGLVGFEPLGSKLNGTSWFSDVCAQGSVDECRFGLAFETNGTGVQYFGKVEHSRFDRPLSKAPLYVDEGMPIPWALYGDTAYEGKVVSRDVLIQTDSGTTVILGPVNDVAALFKSAGVQYFIHKPSNPADSTTLTGYYPCDKPPELGFGFPSISNATMAKMDGNTNVSNHSTIFNVLPSQLEEYRTGNNCTASIRGTDEFGDAWIVGQAFFQGKYIDHNQDDNTMGFATLKGY